LSGHFLISFHLLLSNTGITSNYGGSSGLRDERAADNGEFGKVISQVELGRNLKSHAEELEKFKSERRLLAVFASIAIVDLTTVQDATIIFCSLADNHLLNDQGTFLART